MQLATKYDLGQRVWAIYHDSQRVQAPCAACDGEGQLALVKGGAVQCRECYGRRTVPTQRALGWRVRGPGVVGKVTVERVAARYADDYPDRTVYMLDITGVGSGTLWSEDTLFPSEEDADAEVSARNAAAATEVAA